jgi:probable addiction module antidote protein
MEQQDIKLEKYDAIAFLENEEDVIAYLNAALEDGDISLLNEVLGNIARWRGMTEIADKTGLGRESLYKSLSKSGNPRFDTVLKVVKALGYRFELVALEES